MHTVDLPTIVSGNRLAYLDPHEEIWPRETGQWYDIDGNACYTDTFAPFENLCGFSVRNARYNGTLFRFPLRNAQRDKRVSTHTYDVNKLRELLTALREEAKCILLFLRSVRTVEVFEISESGVHSNLLKVSICETSIDQLAQKRSVLQANLQKLFHAQSFGIREKLSQVVRVQVDVNDSYNHTTSSSKWLVANHVGSHSPEVRKLAQELKVFPWVGVALETSAQNIESSGGRVFCVLPMPLEVSCHLPVHVNGTFSLNDERRELKWRGVERKNDPSAQWNHLLVEELLPLCYASLLLDHAKMLLEPAQFCRAWPDTNKVKGTKWVGLLTPLLTTLLSKDVIPFCKPGGIHRWITVSSATFVPRGTVLPQEVTTALVACEVKLVTATDAIWNALTYCSIQVTCVSPSLTRGELRKSPQSYTSMMPTKKHALLQYCLSDKAYNEMSNLVLLPLANGGFGMFGSPYYNSNPVYLCSQQCPSHLLPTLEGELVSESLDYQLYMKLKEIASGGHTNLRLLTVNDVATLLSRAMQLLQFQNTVTLPWSQFTMQWLRGFWQWVSGNSLHLFANQFLVPISDRTVARLTKASSCLFIPSTQSCSQSLISALEKLAVQCCQQRTHPFLRHNAYLGSLMNFFSADGIIDAIQHASSYSSVALTANEAKELIANIQNVSITYQRQTLLRELPIFATLRNTGEKLYSMTQVEASTGRGAQMEPQNFPLTPEIIPSSVILFSTDNKYQQLLLSRLSVNSTTTVDLLMYTVFKLIERESLQRNAAKKLMKEVLEKFHAITSNVSYQKRQEFESAIGHLPFLPVSAGKPKPPNTLFSPSDEELKNLFYNEPVFPSEPFSGGQCLKVLKQCGLKTSVTRQEIVDIICSISSKASTSPVAVDQAKHTRAKAVLTYIKRWGHQQLSETVHISDYPRPRYGQNLQFSQALRKLSETKRWLPVQATPPSGYPSCLTWRGSGCSRHFISFGSSVMLSEHQDSLALACGSQVYFVEHSLPQAMCKEFTPSPDDVTNHAMAHLKEVILKHTQVQDVKKITFGIYHLLHKCQQQGYTVKLSLLENTEDCVWLTRQKKFVHPNSIALRQNATFQHNLEPFIYILPDDLAEYESIFTELGVQEVVTRSQIMGILEKIKEGNPSSCGISNKQAWNLVMNILRWSTESDNGDEDDDNGPTLVPVEPDTDWPTLVTAEDVVYTDSAFLQRFLETSGDTEEEYTFINHRVSPDLACQLQLTPLSEHLNISEDAFEDVGQSEPLTVRLKNILKDYKDGLTIIKELIQNADDAGATEMNICYDTRYHTDKRESLFFPGMAECHGPALLVNNNAMFTEEDFQNITKLAGATKVGKALKIGKFGVGFCSVYHITDIPSFVSNNLLYIFDPTLTYLKDEIKNPARPGKKMCFTSRFISRSKQLAPYANLFGFDPRSRYEGTTFRFPFRTGISKLSDKMYGAEDVRQLREQIQSSCSKLILFLQKIETITFSQVHRGEEEPHEMMKMTKGKQTLVGNRCIYQVTCSVTGSADMTEFWLVETCTQTILEKYSTAFVACSLSPTDEQLYEVKPIEGEMFCFLPLSVKTGLPLHVSSNFAVSNNRRGIWTSDDSENTKSDKVEWNKSLMEGVICSAYCELLEGLKELQTEKKLSDYDFFSMWPVKGELKIQNPWNFSVKAIYQSVAERELFFSNSTDRWLSLDESKFLHPDILRVSHSATSIPSAVLDVVNHLQLPVVHLPSKYHEFLAISGSTEMEKTFLEHFFTNIDNVEAILDSRNAVLLLALECYAMELNRPDEDRYCYLWEFLQKNACIPCEPDGNLLKAPSELIHPKADFAKLFDVDENVFPLEEFCDKKLVDKAMKELGMLHDSIPLDQLEERATTIVGLYKKDELKALERANLIMNSLQKERDKFSVEECLRISEIPFLPVMEKPEGYLLPWKGDRDTLYPGNEILSLTTTYYDDKASIHLAGSECVILNQNNPSNGGCGVVSYRVKELLQIRSSPTCREVISHFCTLLGHFDGSAQMIKFADPIARKVYEYLEKLLGQAKEHESIDIAPIKEIPCIWTGRMFIECSAVAKKWRQDGPYLFQVPSSINTHKNLKEALEIKEEFSDEELIDALQSIQRDNIGTSLSDDCQVLIRDIVSKITSRPNFQTDLKPIMLPDVDFILHEATELYHNDMPWQPHDDTFKYVHESVPLATAKRLGVKLCRAAHLARYAVPGSGFSIEEFGQHEELTRRIQNIIRDYPFDMTILKELLQNADDAKATKMHVIVDMRTHSDKHILSDEWGELQGPALLVWNDSVFTEEDLKGIQRLGLGSKRSDSETIGQYGIGFNAVYHLTDCPSFLTGGDTLCILDPHMRYVPQATERHPGAMYTNLDDKFWKTFDGLKSAYLLDGVKNRPEELLNGTLLRFPLRHTLHHVKSSDIIRDINQSEPIMSRVISGDKMNELLSEWAPKMKQSLLFLNNVVELNFSVIKDARGLFHLENSYRTKLDKCATQNRAELTDKIKFYDEDPFITIYPLTIVESLMARGRKEEWLIQQGIGDVDKGVQRWTYVEQVKPRHGIAAPLKCEGATLEGQVFCFLPLPLYSGLPVHINGHFILDSTRRNLWRATDSQGDEKSRWNQNILTAIASSYAKFLERMTEYVAQFEGFTSRKFIEEAVTEYYAQFPRTTHGKKHDSPLSEPWLQLTKNVFQTMSEHNPTILAVPTNVSARSSEDKYLLQWQPLRCKQMPASQVYFWKNVRKDTEEKMKSILERIGMKITCAPLWVMEHFKVVKCELPVICRSSVYEFYISFNGQFISSRYPRDIQETPFKCVEDFKSFTEFLMGPESQQPLTAELAFPKKPFGYPLLLNACNQLCIFDEGNKVLCSKYAQLFPKCPERFLHNDLIQCHYSSSYFLTEWDKDRVQIVKELIQTVLPPELKNMYVSSESEEIKKIDIRALWRCFKDDKVFRSAVDEILKVWALLSTKDQKLFRCSSKEQLLPIIPDSSTREEAAVMSVIEHQLRGPFLDTQVVPVEVVGSLCPRPSDHKAMLKNLYYLHREFPFDEVMTSQIATSLLTYFKNIHLKKENKCCMHLKCLPLFETMYGGITVLEGKRVYIWPNNIGQDGNEKWIRGTDLVFLKPWGAWASLGVIIELGIQTITAEETYIQFIFPN